MAKTSSVTDRVKLFDAQNVFGESKDERAREEKAEAIRREILELKSRTLEDENKDLVEIQSPVESKVKPLKIPMKPKVVEGGGAKQGLQRGVPGATLRINQPAGIQTSPQPPEVKSILRSSRSIERNPVTSSSSIERNPMTTSSSSSNERRSSLDNIESVRSRIESYLNAAEDELQPQQQQQQHNNNITVPHGMGQQLQSILVNSEKSRKKSPKLVHSGNNLTIYTQSATDYSEDDEDQMLRNRRMESHLLQIPEHPGDVMYKLSTKIPQVYS